MNSQCFNIPYIISPKIFPCGYCLQPCSSTCHHIVPYNCAVLGCWWGWRSPFRCRMFRWTAPSCERLIMAWRLRKRFMATAIGDPQTHRRHIPTSQQQASNKPVNQWRMDVRLDVVVANSRPIKCWSTDRSKDRWSLMFDQVKFLSLSTSFDPLVELS